MYSAVPSPSPAKMIYLLLVSSPKFARGFRALFHLPPNGSSRYISASGNKHGNKFVPAAAVEVLPTGRNMWKKQDDSVLK